jgi:hypothetical protein
MPSLTFRALLICVFALVLGACSADSDVGGGDDPRPGSPARKPTDAEMDRLITVATTLSGLDSVAYPIDRVFGMAEDVEMPEGEKMYKLLSSCTKTEVNEETSLRQALNGESCPIDYSNSEQMKKTGEIIDITVASSYDVKDKSYMLDGHITSYKSNGESSGTDDYSNSSLAIDFSSTQQGKGLVVQNTATKTTMVSEIRANFTIKANVNLQVGKAPCINERFSLENKPACLPMIKVDVEMAGFVEVRGDEIVMELTSTACFIDGVEFNCQDQSAEKLKVVGMAESLRLAKNKSLQLLRK